MRDRPEAGPRPDERADPRKIYAAMSGLIVAFLVANLDHMIVSTALPTIAGELGGFELLSWVVAAFTLTTAVSTPIWGKLGDLHDRKAVFLTAFSVFLAGSALCGMAQDMIQLIAFRAVQGLGAGGLLVGGIAIIGALVPRRERAKYQGLMATIMPLAILSGPLLGGLITDSIGWRWAFYLNLPVGAVAIWLLLTRLHLPAHPRQRGRLDIMGALALTVGLTALSLVTTLGGTHLGWSSPTIILLAAATVLALLLFIRCETKAEDPIIPLPLFRVRNFSLAAFLSFASGLAMFGAVTFLPLYQQIAREISPTNSGLLLLPLLGGMLATAPVVGGLVTRTGRFRLYPILGSALMTAGMLGLATVSTSTSQALVAASTLAVGIGMGCFMQLTVLIAQNSVSDDHLGAASGTSMLFRNLGNSLGVSLLGALYVARMRSSLSDQPEAEAALITEAGTDLTPSGISQLPDQWQADLQEAVSNGAAWVFLAGAAASALMLIASLLLRSTPIDADH